MSNNLRERLACAKETLLLVSGLVADAEETKGLLPAEAVSQFKNLGNCWTGVKHWNQLLDAREMQRSVLTDLERRTDQDDWVEYLGAKVPFTIVRLLAVQAYLAVHWSLADGMAAMVADVLSVENKLKDPKRKPNLHAMIDGDQAANAIAHVAYNTIRLMYGKEIALSYALRNYFLHEGPSEEFFEDRSSRSRFEISPNGWKLLAERPGKNLIKNAETRRADWSPGPGSDLREIFDTCQEGMDNALGILVGTACQVGIVHLLFVLGKEHEIPLALTPLT